MSRSFDIRTANVPSLSETSEPTAVDRAVRLLREGIERGTYAPGQRLIELDLTAELNVSRSSLREAFRRLGAEGVVENVPNRGAVVRRFLPRDIYNIQQIRRLLEPLAASLAAAAIDEVDNRARFESAAAVWFAKPPIHSIDEYEWENRRFHRTIAEISGNEQLTTILDRLNLPLFGAHFRHLITRERRVASAAQHRKIAIAIRAGDPRAAEKAMKAHIKRSDETVLRDDDQGAFDLRLG